MLLAAPQRGQKAKSGSHEKPHAAQGLGCRRPHRGQKAKSDDSIEATAGARHRKTRKLESGLTPELNTDDQTEYGCLGSLNGFSFITHFTISYKGCSFGNLGPRVAHSRARHAVPAA